MTNATLSCENCAYAGKYCDYPEKTGRIAGEFWCELYWPAKEEREEYYLFPEVVFEHELTDKEKKQYEDYFKSKGIDLDGGAELEY